MENKIMKLKTELKKYNFCDNIEIKKLINDVKNIFFKEFKVEGVTLDYKNKKINVETIEGTLILKIKKENNINKFEYIQWEEEMN